MHSSSHFKAAKIPSGLNPRQFSTGPSHVVRWTKTLFMKLRNEGFSPTLIELAKFLLAYDIPCLPTRSRLLKRCTLRSLGKISSGHAALRELKSIRDSVRLPTEFYRELTEKQGGCVNCVLASTAGGVIGVA